MTHSSHMNCKIRIINPLSPIKKLRLCLKEKITSRINHGRQGVRGCRAFDFRPSQPIAPTETIKQWIINLFETNKTAAYGNLKLGINVKLTGRINFGG